jgi:hypothetical protein
MGTEIAIVRPLPSPAPLAPFPELPAWASTIMREAAGARSEFDPPLSLPSARHRQELENHRAKLSELLEQKPVADQEYAKQSFVLIAKLLLAKPARNVGPEATEAKIEAYLMALDDVPWWAVANAIRKWHRGECDSWRGHENYDYRWAPESADLRRIALRVTDNLKDRISKIEKVLKLAPPAGSA